MQKQVQGNPASLQEMRASLALLSFAVLLCERAWGHAVFMTDAKTTCNTKLAAGVVIMGDPAILDPKSRVIVSVHDSHCPELLR